MVPDMGEDVDEVSCKPLRREKILWEPRRSILMRGGGSIRPSLDLKVEVHWSKGGEWKGESGERGGEA